MARAITRSFCLEETASRIAARLAYYDATHGSGNVDNVINAKIAVDAALALEREMNSRFTEGGEYIEEVTGA